MNVSSREQSSAFLGALRGSFLPRVGNEPPRTRRISNSEPATRCDPGTGGGWMWRPRFD